MTKEAKNRAVCKEIAELTAEVNAKKKRLEELKSYIKVETGGVTTDFGTWVVEFYERATETVDIKRLKVEAPEVFAEYGKTSSSNILKVKAKR